MTTQKLKMWRKTQKNSQCEINEKNQNVTTQNSQCDKTHKHKKKIVTQQHIPSQKNVTI